MKNILQNIGLAVFSGVLTFLAFPPFELAPLAWIAIIPLLFAVRRSENIYGAFYYSFLSGFVFLACTGYWLTNVTILGTVALLFILAFLYGLFGSLARIVFKYAMDLLIIPFLWVMMEFVRSHIFTGFPWAFLSYSQYQNTLLIQVADFTGPYGVSFLIAAFNMAIFALITRAKGKMAYLAAALLLMVMAMSYGSYRLNNYHVWASPRISVVQGNIPQELKWDADSADGILTNYEKLTIEAVRDKPDMVIWPETAYPYLAEPNAPPEEIGRHAKELKTSILAGAIYREGETYYNGAMLFDKKGEVLEVYKKTHLVPFGEYVPLEKYLFGLLRKYIDKPIGDFKKGDRYTIFLLESFSSFSGKDGSRVRSISFCKFGVMICFEDAFPYIARKFVKNGANLLVNITNDGWFGPTAAAKQHLQASVFRAVENKVPVVRSANTGISCFIDPFGRVFSQVEKGGKNIFVRGYATANVDISRGRSFYTEYGDMFVYFCLFMTVILFCVEAFLRRKKGVC